MNDAVYTLSDVALAAAGAWLLASLLTVAVMSLISTPRKRVSARTPKSSGPDFVAERQSSEFERFAAMKRRTRDATSTPRGAA